MSNLFWLIVGWMLIPAWIGYTAAVIGYKYPVGTFFLSTGLFLASFMVGAGIRWFMFWR